MVDIKYDNTIKKTWFVLSLGTWWNDKPKDEKEKQWFEHVKQEALRIGDKVIEIHFNKTEYEFYNRWKAK